VPAEADDALPTDEPRLDLANIQGNIWPGFNKDNQMLLLLRIDDVAACKAWLGWLTPMITSAAEVRAYLKLMSAANALKATWTNIGFSFTALRRLTEDATRVDGGQATQSVDLFEDAAFREGLAARAQLLGDLTDEEGKPEGWVVGGPDNPVDIILLVASDDPCDLNERVEQLEQSIYAFWQDGQPAQSGVRIVFEQPGANLPGPLAGHEQFGFKDGISQPGLRGIASGDPHDFLTPRQNPRNPDQGKPGQDLIWPGEFVFGHPGQKVLGSDGGQRPLSGSKDYRQAPDWAADGSFLVFRRLRQDVYLFHRFLHDNSDGLSPSMLGAKVVGRWASGAPLMRAPDADNPELGDNDCANNDFEFAAKDPYFLKGAPPKGVAPPDVLPSAASADCGCCIPASNHPVFDPSPGDRDGKICPFTSHIREAYPRDDPPTGREGEGEVDTDDHRLLRRGIPYGPASKSTPEVPVNDKEDRGLLFLAYQTSIDDQFEFITRHWFNRPNLKEEGESEDGRRSGYDLIVGQNNRPGENRARTFRLTVEGETEPRTLTAPADWVIPTGGGYFFVPSIEALGKVFARKFSNGGGVMYDKAQKDQIEELKQQIAILQTAIIGPKAASDYVQKELKNQFISEVEKGKSQGAGAKANMVKIGGDDIPVIPWPREPGAWYRRIIDLATEFTGFRKELIALASNAENLPGIVEAADRNVSDTVAKNPGADVKALKAAAEATKKKARDDANAKKIIEQALSGYKFPDGVRIEVCMSDPKTLKIVLPALPSDLAKELWNKEGDGLFGMSKALAVGPSAVTLPATAVPGCGYGSADCTSAGC
jgi:Dyp-type peroxidase family